MSSARPRLLVLASTYPRRAGDPEPAFVHALCRALAAEFDVTALVPDAAGADPSGPLDGVQVERYRYAPRRWQTLVHGGGMVTNLRRAPWKWLLVPGFFLAQYCAARRLLRDGRFVAIHAHWLVPQGVIAALLRQQAPSLVTCQGGDVFALRSAPARALKRWVVRRAAAVTAVGEPMRPVLADLGVDPAAVAVEPMGVDLQGRFAPDPRAPRHPGELLFVGRLVEKKGLGHLLAAMPAIITRRPDAFLTVVGAGPDEPALRAQAARVGVAERVRFVGARPQAELPALYRHAAAFVAPFVEAASGDQEGLPLTMIEAAGCGCALVLGDVPATRSVFNGQAGAHIVDARDPARLAAACLDALGAPPPGPAAAAQLLARFDWAGRAAAYARILRSIARPA
jgi:glycosyltransferase involved in cell wall biosynthesis